MIQGNPSKLSRLWRQLCLSVVLAVPQVTAAEGKTAKVVVAPEEPTTTRGTWVYYAGTLDIDEDPFFDPHGIDFKWAYARKDPLPADPRIVVQMHGSGGGKGFVELFAPAPAGDLEVRTQDADTYNPNWREWWTFGADGQPYPGRRIAAVLGFVTDRYDIDTSRRGIVLEGSSMGGAGSVIQTMILPAPWRGQIAYSAGIIGPMLPREVAKKSPGQYISMAPDNDRYRAAWDGIDFVIQAERNPVVRGMHYRHRFSSDDIFSRGLSGSTQLEFVNLVEKHKIGGAFAWAKADHGTQEAGVRLPNLMKFEQVEMDVTLDRAHPALTGSSGNYPLTAEDRIDEARFPRGHYNMGITWDHANIVDTAQEIVFPLRYLHREGIGKDIPDQPIEITVDVTPRRPKNFVLADGEVLHWSFDGGVLSGSVVVTGDVVTVEGIPLRSGAAYKNLRIYR
ncbi:MAG: hypothetical protein HRT77_06050 [Halioglobus sp.]|nr:hypothetical protein [Halioglobus sp.]